ncbi:hypothetical protein GIB67_030772 [Kingdonia uniflora]|uniref:Pentatricopeptide repeat-containing protein n=1 Tax=Kingdonia uniflora TaxID=39325 RepID=A0A7J7L380_9MAGN|nr:hypothetical protein GIB67_030772 [Kingdonia uniflora]
MPERGVKPDNVTFLTIISCARVLSLPLNAIEWFEKMPKFGCQPDVVTYSIIIDAYGRTGNFDEALNVYEEMKALGVKEKGFVPSWATYASLWRAYGRAQYGEDAMNVYKEMKEKGLEMNVVLYNTLLAMCADMGYTDEVTDDVVRVFDRHHDLGITPGDQFCGCLLNVMTQTPKEELGKLIGCIESVNSKLGSLVKHLVEEESNNGVLRQEAGLLFDVISKDKKPVADAKMIEEELLPQSEADKIDTMLQELKFHKRSFESGVDSVSAIAASHLWQLVVVRADLNGLLKALKDYFQLAKGDFFQAGQS